MTGREVAIPGAGAHGGDGARVAAALGVPVDAVLDLSASLNPFAPDVAVLAARHLGALRRYPDVEAAERLVAEMVGVDPERLVLTAGGAQAIALVADHLGAGWVDEPDFSLYLRHLPRLDPAAPVWRSDPHNPTGTLAPDDPPLLADPFDAGGSPAGHDSAARRSGPYEPGDVAAAGGVARSVGVWDEAFLPLSAGVWTRGRAGWALGSLTKAFACPGLRLGYAVAPSGGDAAAVRERRPAWAVGGLACAVLPELVAESDPPGWTAQIAVARKATAEVLVAHGLDPLPSDAPWLVVPGAAGLRDALARRAVVVRDCTSFGLPDHVRIAVPDERGLARLAGALTRAQSSASDPTE